MGKVYSTCSEGYLRETLQEDPKRRYIVNVCLKRASMQVMAFNATTDQYALQELDYVQDVQSATSSAMQATRSLLLAVLLAIAILKLL